METGGQECIRCRFKKRKREKTKGGLYVKVPKVVKDKISLGIY